MKKSNKLIILNVVIAIVCVGLYVILIPHSVKTEQISRQNYNAVVTIFPLTIKKVVIEACKIFVIVLLPTIIYCAKRLARHILIRKGE